MSRRVTIALILWLLLAVACGSDDPAPTSAVAGDRNETTSTTAGAAVPENTSDPGSTVQDGGTPAPPADDQVAEPTETVPTVSDSPTSTQVVAEEPTTTEPTTEAPTTTAYSGPVSPVTGFPIEDVDLLDRKLIAVKIDNHRRAQPQSGLEAADAVYEVVVEGGFTRFIALFHNSDSEWVGPMRSARPTDWTLVRPLNGALLISGGQPWITRQITRNDVPLIGDLGPPLTARWSERRAPHNLYVDTYVARQVANDRDLGRTAPPTLFNRGPLSGPEGAVATQIFFDWSQSVDVAWLWDGERYLRFSDGKAQEWRSREGDESGQISADLLVVLMAERYTACPQGDGSCVPAWDTVGENRAIVFAEGRYVEGRWRRDRAADWFIITDQLGNRITVPPGRPWIMIYPDTSNVDW